MAEQVQTIYGPLAPSARGTIIYSVALGNGYVVTSPEGFGDDDSRDPKPLAYPQRLPAPQVS